MSTAKTMHDLMTRLVDHAKVVVEQEERLTNENADLRSQVNELSAQNSTQQLKISELTLEVARLNNTLNEATVVAIPPAETSPPAAEPTDEPLDTVSLAEETHS